MIGSYSADISHAGEIWDLEAQKSIGELNPADFSTEATVIAFSPDSRWMITGSEDLQLWDVETGTEIDVLDKVHATGVAFSTDGSTIVTASSDQTVRFWSFLASTQSLVDYAKQVVPRCLTGEQNERAYLEPAPPDWCIEMAKWPYDKPEWKKWLSDARVGRNPPLPAAP